jgi:hypothetical protein
MPLREDGIIGTHHQVAGRVVLESDWLVVAYFATENVAEQDARLDVDAFGYVVRHGDGKC